MPKGYDIWYRARRLLIPVFSSLVLSSIERPNCSSRVVVCNIHTYIHPYPVNFSTLTRFSHFLFSATSTLSVDALFNGFELRVCWCYRVVSANLSLGISMLSRSREAKPSMILCLRGNCQQREGECRFLKQGHVNGERCTFVSLIVVQFFYIFSSLHCECFSSFIWNLLNDIC